jgi:hypothetical protein
MVRDLHVNCHLKHALLLTVHVTIFQDKILFRVQKGTHSSTWQSILSDDGMSWCEFVSSSNLIKPFLHPLSTTGMFCCCCMIY